MRYLTLLMVILLFITCQSDEEELIGHWHVEFVGSTDEYTSDEYFTMDIVDDSTAYKDLYNKERINHWSHNIDQNKQLIRITAECYNEFLNYSVNNKRLFLSLYRDLERQITISYVGVKHERDTCNKQTAYYEDFPIKIDLPTYPLLDLDTLSYNYYQYFSVRELYFGKTKPNRGLNTGDSTIVFAHSNKRVSINDLELQEEIDKISEREDDNRTKILIIEADQSTLLHELIPYINFYKNRNRNLIYFAVRSEDIYTNFQVKYKVINVRTVDWKTVEDLTIQAWLDLQ